MYIDKNINETIRSLISDKHGVTAVIVGVSLLMLVSFAALAIDISHLFVVRNELQNAADSAALAGARDLYLADGTAVNTGANTTAYNAAVSNMSESVPVDVHGLQGGDIQRGHWSFATRAFTPNSSTAPPDLQQSSDELDADPDFINAVRVVTRREDTPAISFLAGIFGYTDFVKTATAIAYIGFAGDLAPGDVDQPIAICRESILDADGAFTCGVGRMLNSGGNPLGHQTGGWTNFSQPCQTASDSSVRPLICASGNLSTLSMGQGMGTVNGTQGNIYSDLYDCWKNNAALDTDGDKWPDKFWPLTLPVVTCPDNNIGNCSILVGAVEVNVVWMTKQDKNQFREVPMKMENWTCPAGYTGQQCWTDFADHFNLEDVLNKSSAAYEDKTIYFLPDCTIHEPTGQSGGDNFGFLSKYPVLVD